MYRELQVNFARKRDAKARASGAGADDEVTANYTVDVLLPCAPLQRITTATGQQASDESRERR